MNRNWLQHALEDTPWRLQRQVVALAGLGFFVAIIIGALYLAQSASVATLGRQLEALIAKRNDLEQTNEQLRAEIASYRTVSRLLARARELGFEEADENQILYLYVPGYNPNRGEVAATPAPQQTKPLPTYDESFVGWLQQQWDNLRRQFQGFSGATAK
jgi:cell division protein FtsB